MNIAIIGAGPSGMMCAYEASKNTKNNITIFDSNEKVGKKLFITGKGRCNVCNDCSCQEFLNNVVSNNKFLYSAINNFTPEDTKRFIEGFGTKLKVERGNRVFPVSDKSVDIINAFKRAIRKQNIVLRLNCKVERVTKEDSTFYVTLISGEKASFDAVVVATGGLSYPLTGSTGDGFMFAKKFLHEVVKPRPALCPIILQNYDKNLCGLSLKNVKISYFENKKEYSFFGEMLFTNSGVSGPIVLSLSSFINKFDIKDKVLHLDLKPALTFEILENRLVRDKDEFKNKELKNYLKTFMPQKLVGCFLKQTGILPEKLVCNLSKQDYKIIINTLKDLQFTIRSLDGVESGIVTSGGVEVKNLNPKTMQSKLINNLYFVGEVVNVDALTGGFNIQIALSTGFLAGKDLCEKNKMKGD